MQAAERIICALDVDSAECALERTRELRGSVGVFKVGLELLNAADGSLLAELRNAGAERIFYDAKLHDIPNTVAGAMRGIAKRGVWCVTVHAAGGSAMLRAAVEAAREAADKYNVLPPKIFAVTLLTSLSADALRDELRVSESAADYVRQMAQMAQAAGCDGVIASPLEIELVRQAIPERDFLIVTPGIRPAGAEKGDQARAMTPGEAMQRGADYLVIGRPILAAPAPNAAAQAISQEMEAAMTPLLS